MSAKQNTAVIFDADGVVIRSEFYSETLKRDYGVSDEVLVDFFHNEFPPCITGERDLLDVVEPFIKAIGWSGDADSLMEAWFEGENSPDENLLGEIRKLREEGFTVGLGTNQEKHRVTFMRSRMGFSEIFDMMYPSCEIGYAKPDPRYFQRIEENLKKQGIKRIVFFDDNQKNVQAALDASWEAYRYQGIEDFLSWKTASAESSD